MTWAILETVTDRNFLFALGVEPNSVLHHLPTINFAPRRGRVGQQPGEDSSPEGEPVSGSIPNGNKFRRVVMASPLVNVRAHNESQQTLG